MASFTTAHVGVLLHKLREVQYEAKDFGVQLGLKNSDIEAIYKQSHKTPRECLQQVFSLWLKQPSKHRTWAVLLQALRRDSEQVIANTIERRYTLDQSVSVPLHDLLSLVEGINTTHWRSLGLYLGLSLSQINEIDDRGEWSECMMIELLSLWVRGNGNPATLDTLVTAVRELQNFDLAERLTTDNDLIMKLSEPRQEQEDSTDDDKTNSDGGESNKGESNSDEGESSNTKQSWIREVQNTQQRIGLMDNVSESALIKAMGGVSIKMKLCNISLHGPPGSGKTSLKRLILGQSPLPKEEQSTTGIIETASRASYGACTYRRLTDGKKILAEVKNKNLIEMIAKKVQSLHIPSQMPQCEVSYDSTQQYIPEKQQGSNSISQSMKSIIQQMAKHDEPSPEIFDDNWIHLIDTGGQPQFQDVFPLLFHKESLDLVVIRLDQGLDDKPVVQYYHKGNVYMNPSISIFSNREFIERACQMAQPNKVMIVGTHKDKLGINSKAKLKQINEELTKVYQKYSHVLVCKSKDEIIFAVNTMAPDGGERQQYTEDLQECVLKVAEETGYEIDVPLKWFAFYLDLDKTGGIVQKSECYKTGEILGMKKSDVDEALKYFKKVKLLLYYPDDVPDLIFTKMEVLIGRLSTLITSSFITPESTVTAPYNRLREKGLFNKSYLPTIFEHLYESRDEFSDDDFLRLLECLKIAVHVGDDDYFFPCALSLEPFSHILYKSNCIPLVFTWDGQFLSPGFYYTLVVVLLQQRGRDGIYFEMRKGISGQTRQEIMLRVPGAGDVKLCDRKTWLEVHYFGDIKHCFQLQKTISSVITTVLTMPNYSNFGSPTIGFLCNLCSTFDHYCVPSDDQDIVSCSRINKTGPLSTESSCWIKSGGSSQYSNSHRNVDTHGIFSVHLVEMLNVISYPERLACDLFVAQLISHDMMRNLLTTVGISRYKKTSRILDHFMSLLRTFNNREHFITFCKILTNQDNLCLTRIAEEMLMEIDQSTETTPNNIPVDDTPETDQSTLRTLDNIPVDDAPVTGLLTPRIVMHM